MENDILNKHIKKWKLNEISQILDEAEDDIEKAIRKKNIKTNEDYHNIVLRILGKAIRIYREIIVLSMYGYPNGSFLLARTIYENFIILGFFENHKNDIDFNEYIEDYYLDYDIKQKKELKYESEFCIKDPNETNKLNNEISNLKNKAHKEVKGEYWWSGTQTFYNLFKEVMEKEDPSMQRFLNVAHATYKLSSISMHSSCLGNIMNLGGNYGYEVISTAQEMEGHGLPLWFATISFIYLLGVCCNELNIEYKKYKNRLNKLAQYYFSMNKGEVTQ